MIKCTAPSDLYIDLSYRRSATAVSIKINPGTGGIVELQQHVPRSTGKHCRTLVSGVEEGKFARQVVSFWKGQSTGYLDGKGKSWSQMYSRRKTSSTTGLHVPSQLRHTGLDTCHS